MNITINHLQKAFGRKIAVDIENYFIPKGEIVGLVGNNGAGKTTLFRLILDLLKADQGYVEIAGIRVSQSEEWKKFVGAYIDKFSHKLPHPNRIFLFCRKNVWPK